MDRNQQQIDEVIDLGVASVETQGVIGLAEDNDTSPAMSLGISND